MVFVSASTIPINRALYRNLSYDPHRDLVPVVIAATTPNALVVPGNSPFHSLAELVAAGRNPTTPILRYFSPGNGTSQHLSAVQVINGTGIRSEHIPYRSPTEGLTAVLANEVDWGFSAVPSVVGYVREGRMRMLAATGTASPAALPDVPTFASLGLRGFEETDVWYGIAAPRETPAGPLAALRQAFRQSLDEPAVRARLSAAGFYPAPAMTGPEMEEFVTRQVAFWADLVKASGATID
jgi:tripartite-type tricarboxylate transporter receptor subunit TctC